MPENTAETAKSGEMRREFRPKSGASPSNQRPLLKEQLNLEHPLVKMSQAIEWSNFEAEFSKQMSSEGGRPGLSTRLMVGLHYLKALYNAAVCRKDHLPGHLP